MKMDCNAEKETDNQGVQKEGGMKREEIGGVLGEMQRVSLHKEEQSLHSIPLR
jgi:hypothetical protein